MIAEYLERHIAWSRQTFGDGAKTESICRHIEKELNEIRATPQNLEEWVDVMILALDGAWRAGHSPAEIMAGLWAKQEINKRRQWQTPASPEEPIEHVREGED